MGRIDKTLDRILTGKADAGIRLPDARSLLLHLGFIERTRSSHHVFGRLDVAEHITLSAIGGYLPRYQVRNLRRILRLHGFGGQHDG